MTTMIKSPDAVIAALLVFRLLYLLLPLALSILVVLRFEHDQHRRGDAGADTTLGTQMRSVGEAASANSGNWDSNSASSVLSWV